MSTLLQVLIQTNIQKTLLILTLPFRLPFSHRRFYFANDIAIKMLTQFPSCVESTVQIMPTLVARNSDIQESILTFLLKSSDPPARSRFADHKTLFTRLTWKSCTDPYFSQCTNCWRLCRASFASSIIHFMKEYTST